MRPFSCIALLSSAATLTFSLSATLVSATHIRSPKHTMSHSSYRLYLAGYGGEIQPFTFTPPSTLAPTSEASKNLQNTRPSWLAYTSSESDPKRQIVYSVDEGVPGRVFAYVADSKTGALTEIGTPAQIKNGSYPNGDGPVALSLTTASSGERCLFAANYNSGTVGVFALNKDGSIVSTSDASPSAVESFQFKRPASDPIGPVSSRQDHSYAHEVVTSPDGRFIYVSDLGADQIHRLQVGDQCKTTSVVGSTDVAAGSGPRHLAFWPPGQSTVGGQAGAHPHPHPHPDAPAPATAHNRPHPPALHPQGDKTYAYLASELACTLTAFSVDSKTGELTRIGEPILAVPANTPLGGTPEAGPQRTVAEVAVSPDGRFVYVSDRGDTVEDHITIYARDVATGGIKWLKWVPSGGVNPRHFSLSLDPQAKYLAVGHQNTNNSVIFERDAISGDLKNTGAEYKNFEQLAFTGFAPFPAQ